MFDDDDNQKVVSEQVLLQTTSGSNTTTQTPTATPTSTPTGNPTTNPTGIPTAQPTKNPTIPTSSFYKNSTQGSFGESACPVVLVTKPTDPGTYSWVDTIGEIYDLVSPDIADNAGWYQAHGWDRRPKITPSRALLTGLEYAVGNNTVKFNLADQYGNRKSCEIIVWVVDTEGPVLTCPENKNYEVDQSCQAYVSWTPPTATDNDPRGVTIHGPNGGSNNVVYSPGAYEIEYSGTDRQNNIETCSFDITVEDKMAPQFMPGMCMASEQVYTHHCGAVGEEAGVSVNWMCLSNDNCDGPVLTVCREWILIEGQRHGFHPTSNELPTVHPCGSDLDSALNACEGYKFCIVDTTTFCSSGLDRMKTMPIPATSAVYFRADVGDHFPIPPQTPGGQQTHYQVTCDSTDSSMNTAAQSFSFSVVDAREPPIFTHCPQSQTLTLPSANSTMKAGFSPPTVASMCNVNVWELGHKDENTTLAAGVHLFDYVAADEGGNVASCKFQITVLDKEELNWVGCPSVASHNLTFPTDELLGRYAIVNWEHPAVYKRGIQMNSSDVTINFPDLLPGMAFPLGKTLVVYTVTDLRGHMNNTFTPECEFEIEVVDLEDPTFEGWGDIHKCNVGESGVAENEQCGGYKIEVTKNATNFRHNIAYTVGEVDYDCCGSDYSCLPYGNSHGLYKKCTHTP